MVKLTLQFLDPAGMKPAARWKPGSVLLPQMDLVEAGGGIDEGFQQDGVELTGAFGEHLYRAGVAQGRAVRAARTQCLVHRHDRQHAGGERNVRAGEHVRVAGAVPPFVVPLRDIAAHAQVG